MRTYLPELVALPLLPLLLAQGRHTRRITASLPEADGLTTGRVGSQYAGLPLSVIAVGESPVAGVGGATQGEAITAQFARALAAHMQVPVTWSAYGKSGATAHEALEQILPGIPQARVDIALVVFGVNDATAFHTVRRWNTDLQRILAVLGERCSPRLTILSGVPHLARFPALPQPLRWVMGLKAQALDMAARVLAQHSPRTIHVPFVLDAGDPALFAHDVYHPSAQGCAAWAQGLAIAGAAALNPVRR